MGDLQIKKDAKKYNVHVELHFQEMIKQDMSDH